MSAFLEMLLKITPLIIYTIIGYGSRKILKTDKNQIASLLIYFLLPIITFHGIFTVELSNGVIFLPIIFYIVAAIITFTFVFIGNKILKDNRANLVGFATSYGNYAYFAIPASIAFFGTESESLVIAAGFGFTLYTTTIGYYVTARGKFSTAQSLAKTLSLPSTYTFFLGLIFNKLGFGNYIFSNIAISQIYTELIKDVRGIFTILGMMILGIAVAEVKKLHFDFKFTLLALAAKFIVWPAMILFIIFLDQNFIHVIDSSLSYNIMLLLSLVPTGTTLVAYSSQLGVHPDKASMVVISSSLIALIYIPLVLSLIKFN